MSQTNQSRKISVAEMAPHVHSFAFKENKVNKITEWLAMWIEASLKEGKIKPYDYLPSKGELAFHICVSLGTMQNVFRSLEDRGLVESKQRKGTYIKDFQSAGTEKLTSKREEACETIKKHIKENNYKINDILLSTRRLALQTGIPATTIRIAINSLITEGILKKENNVFRICVINFDIKQKEHCTLVEKIASKITLYIKKNLKPDGKLPANTELAKIFNVSVKTVHDSIKLLSKEGVVKTRRGNYGTIVVGSDKNEPYFYEKTEQKIKQYIRENCEVGDKLPSIRNFALMLRVSPKTVKKALDNIAEDGYVTFTRGRYGGTFVTDKPLDNDSSYTWLALSPEYEKKNEN